MAASASTVKAFVMPQPLVEPRSPERRTEILILVASTVLPNGAEKEKCLQAEIDRMVKFRDTGIGGPLTPIAIGTASLGEAASAIREYRPALVHFKSDGSFPIFGTELPQNFLDCLAEKKTAPVTCAVLENCFSLETAETIAEYVQAVAGINGPFADDFLETFYARLIIDGPYYELFDAALYSFFHHYGEKKDVKPEERPYFITRDLNCVSAGNAALTFGVPGMGFAGAREPPPDPARQPVAYPLFFATNRKACDENDVTKGYTSERDTKLHLGRCTVIVPKSHKIGSLGTPRWKQLVTLSTDDRLKLNRESLKEFPEEKYYEIIRAELKSAGETNPSNVLYIHGYRTSFEDAALRAAQLGVDLKVAGVMAFFSWPSKGQFTGYTADEASIEASEEYLTIYLSKLAESVGDGRLNVIAHSMGNRALLRAMKEVLVRTSQRAGIRFGQIFLAAPDVDAETFTRLAQAYKSMAARTTLYVSSKDLALSSSGIIHEYARAGFVPPVTILDGIDTIEASLIDLSFLGHGYYADARSLLQDMHVLLGKDTPPAKRLGLYQKIDHGRPYWVISS